MTRGGRPAIVIVSHFCPFPTAHGNCSRLVALLKWLRANGFRVSYILQPNHVEPGDGVQELRDAVDKLEIVPSPNQRVGMAASVKRICGRAARAILPGMIVGAFPRLTARPRQSALPGRETTASGEVGGDRHIDSWCWPSTRAYVRRAVRRDRPIAVIAEYVLLSQCLEGVDASIMKMIDTNEIFFRYRERFHVEGLVAPFACTQESELIALNRADVLIAIQKNDAEVLRELLPQKRIITVGHTYARADWRSRRPENGVILYVGSSNAFNVHGLRQFVLQALPRIAREAPHAMLRIVGSCPRIEGVEDERLVYVGRVSDEELTREYRRAHVVVNPQVAGTGLKIKCVEALSAGCPLVVNRAGADGFEEGAGRAFLLASDWDEFACHVVTVLNDEALARGLEAEAVKFARRLFSEEATFAELAFALKGEGSFRRSANDRRSGGGAHG